MRQKLLSTTQADFLGWLLCMPHASTSSLGFKVSAPRGVTAATVGAAAAQGLVTVGCDGRITITDTGRERFATQHGDAAIYNARRFIDQG